jgi:hypothetical protein
VLDALGEREAGRAPAPADTDGQSCESRTYQDGPQLRRSAPARCPVRQHSAAPASVTSLGDEPLQAVPSRTRAVYLQAHAYGRR